MLPNDLTATLKLLYALWMAAVGGAVGSFLNVVVYRVPAGLGLITPGSHCPVCKRPIRWYDNVPVFGWMWLGGRCRDCRAKISARYPIVEALTAAIFFALGWVEILSGGANLPARPVAVIDGVIFPALQTGQLLGIGLYHAFLVCTLLAAALIEWDGHRLPIRVVVPALVVGLFAPAVWPHLHPMPAWQGISGWLGGLADGLAGLIVGLAIGWCVAWIVAKRRRPGLIWTAGCVGLFLGYQAVVLIALLLLVVLFLQAVLGRLRPAWRVVPPTTWLTVSALGWILAWKPLASLMWP